MIIEQALYALLSGDALVQSIVNDRVYAVNLPQYEKGKQDYPALVFSLRSRDRHYTHEGPDGLVESKFVLDCISKEYFECKQLADAVRLALNGNAAGLAALYDDSVRGVFFDSEEDSFLWDEIEELSLYHIPIDVSIQHKEWVNQS